MKFFQDITLAKAIECIKVIRSAYGLHLLESKQFVDFVKDTADKSDIPYEEVEIIDILGVYRFMYMGAEADDVQRFARRFKLDRWHIFWLYVEIAKLKGF